LRAAGGLSIVEWRVLWDLVEVGPMTIGEMAEIQRVDPSQLSRALPGMRKKGFVVAGQGNRDGRQVMVEIAPAGKLAYEKAEPIMRRRRRTLTNVFSDAELAEFIDMLDRFETLCRSSIDPILEGEPKT
jgi:DNA-binding MarR family transcriptional regulator